MLCIFSLNWYNTIKRFICSYYEQRITISNMAEEIAMKKKRQSKDKEGEETPT